MEIADKQTLSILLIALHVTKWESDDQNSHVKELSGSPFFAKLYNDAVDEMLRLEADRPDVAQSWHRWRTIEADPARLTRTTARIARIDLWSSWSRAEKQHMVEILISPFTATAATLERLLSL